MLAQSVADRCVSAVYICSFPSLRGPPYKLPSGWTAHHAFHCIQPHTRQREKMRTRESISIEIATCYVMSKWTKLEPLLFQFTLGCRWPDPSYHWTIQQQRKGLVGAQLLKNYPWSPSWAFSYFPVSIYTGKISLILKSHLPIVSGTHQNYLHKTGLLDHPRVEKTTLHLKNCQEGTLEKRFLLTVWHMTLSQYILGACIFWNLCLW